MHGDIDTDWEPFKNLISQKTGIYFKDHQIDRLHQAIHEKMSDRAIKCYHDYFNLLIENEEEFNDLAGLLTINETYFFREPAHLNLFTSRLIPELVETKPQAKIHILSAGCSTGAELYSIAISLIEKNSNHPLSRFCLCGFDIDKKAIRIARKGVYGKQCFRAIDPYLKQIYFEKTQNNKFKINDFIIDQVKFHTHNLLHTPYPVPENGVDIIFYRNVSIYFEPENRKKIFENLAGILKDNGYLLLSSSETLPHNLNILPLVEMDGIFLYQKKTIANNISGNKKNSTKKETVFPSKRKFLKNKTTLKPKQRLNKTRKAAEKSLLTSDMTTPALKRTNKSEILEHTESDRFKAAQSLSQTKNYEQAIVIIDDLIKANTQYIDAYALKASIMINLSQTEAAKTLCAKALEIDPFYLQCYLLHGLIAKNETQLEYAVQIFKKALYIDSSCWLAHFYLAEIYKDMKKTDHSFQEYEIVINLLEKKSHSDHDFAFFPFRFSTQQILHLSRHAISQLKNK